MDWERMVHLTKQGFPIALAPAQMLSLLESQQQLEAELAELKQIAAGLATTGAMAVGALPNNSPVAAVVVAAVKQYNAYAYRGQDESR